MTFVLELQQLCCLQSLCCVMPSWSLCMCVLHSVTGAPGLQQTHPPQQRVHEGHHCSRCSGGSFSLCCKLVRKTQHQTCNIRPDVRDGVIPTAHNSAMGQRSQTRPEAPVLHPAETPWLRKLGLPHCFGQVFTTFTVTSGPSAEAKPTREPHTAILQLVPLGQYRS